MPQLNIIMKNKKTQSAKKVRQDAQAQPKLSKNSLVDASLFWMYALLVIIVLVLYGKTITYDFAIDDKIIIVENKYVKNGLTHFSSLVNDLKNNDLSTTGATRPVTMFTHALDVSMYGMKPGLHHLTNVLLYIILALLLVNLLKKHLIPSYSGLLSLGVVLLFVVHPVHVESVANIKGRDDILCFIFGTLSLLFSFHYVQKRAKVYQFASIVFLLCSMLSKETGVAFAVLIPLSHYYFRESTLSKTLTDHWLILATGLLFVFARLFILTDAPENINLYNNSLLAITDTTQRSAMTLRILLYYLQLLFWPSPLVWDYSLGFFEFNSSTRILALVALSVYGLLIAWEITTLKNKNAIGYGIAFFLITLFPVSNVAIKIAATFGERLLFIPSFGFAFGLVFLIRFFILSYLSKPAAPSLTPAYILVLGLAVVGIFQTAARTDFWKNETVLVNHDYSYTKSLRSSRAYVQNLTSTPDNTTNFQLALEASQEALTKFPTDWQLWYFQGVIQNTLKKPNEAKKAYHKALEFNGNNFFTLVNYAELVAEEKPDTSITLLKRAVGIRSDNPKVLGNLGILLHKKGNLQEAKEMYEKSLSLDPNNTNISSAYGILQRDLGIKASNVPTSDKK